MLGRYTVKQPISPYGLGQESIADSGYAEFTETEYGPVASEWHTMTPEEIEAMFLPDDVLAQQQAEAENPPAPISEEPRNGFATPDDVAVQATVVPGGFLPFMKKYWLWIAIGTPVAVGVIRALKPKPKKPTTKLGKIAAKIGAPVEGFLKGMEKTKKKRMKKMKKKSPGLYKKLTAAEKRYQKRQKAKAKAERKASKKRQKAGRGWGGLSAKEVSDVIAKLQSQYATAFSPAEKQQMRKSIRKVGGVVGSLSITDLKKLFKRKKAPTKAEIAAAKKKARAKEGYKGYGSYGN
jgi:hypothetical protein